jgi:hypothetical protein
MSKKVYYFCQRVFKGIGINYYYENQCVRVLEGDPRLAQLYKKYYKLGFRHEIEYRAGSPAPYDLEWEKNQIVKEDYVLHGRCAGHTVIMEEEKMR